MGRFNMISRGAAPVAPVNSVAPVVSGSATQGSTLTSTTGTWSGSPTYAYQWKRAGTNISGATSSTYATVVGDIGSSVTCTVTATNGAGSASAGSNGITVTSASGSFTVSAGSGGETAYSAFKPIALDRTLARTTTVPAGDELINLQAEVLMPYSPNATGFTVSGADNSSWQQGAIAGTITLTSAARAAISRASLVTHTLTVTPYNAIGTGNTVTLTVKIPASSKEFFIAQSGLNTTFDDGSYAKPWKNLPGSADFVGTAKTFAAGDFIFLKAETHRTTHSNSKTATNSYQVSGMTGSTGNPIWVEMNGWGGRAILDGSDVVTGWTSVTQAEVGGNANYASIKKLDLTSQGGALAYYQRLYDGTSQLYPAQWPTPDDIKVHALVDYVQATGSERFGTRNVPCQSSGGTRRIYTNGSQANLSGTTVTIVDPDIATLFGNVALANISPQVMLRNGSNFWTVADITSYTWATGTLVINTTTSLNNENGNGTYALLWWPGNIAKVGQYALSADGLTLYAWLPENSTTTVSRRGMAVPWGQNGYVTYSGGTYQRYCTGTLRTGVDYHVGTFACYRNNSFVNEADVINPFFNQINHDDGGGVFHMSLGGGVGGFASSNIELAKFTECNDSSGLRSSGQWNGTTGVSGSFSAIRAGAKGKIRGCYAAPNSLGQTFCYMVGSDGLHFTLNVLKDFLSIHGNGLSPYDRSDAGLVNLNLVADFNYFDNAARAYTNEIYYAGPRNIYVGDNVILNQRYQGAAIQLNSGESGGRFTRNLIMGSPSDAGYNQSQIFQIGSGAGEIDHSVIAGLSKSGNGTNWIGNIHDNLITIDDQTIQTPSSSGGSFTSNLTYTGTPNAKVYKWNGTFTSDMQTALGSGQIGPFWTI